MSDQSVFVPVPWETRNLGIPSFAVSEDFLVNPDAQRLAVAIATQAEIQQQFFVQARIPKKYYAACPILEQHSFYFIESVLSPYIPCIHNPVLNRFLLHRDQFLPSRYQIQQFSFTQYQELSYEVSQELKDIAYKSFVDDRFHLDRNCRQELASQRFTYWIDDLIADVNAMFFVLRYQGDMVGFGAFKSNIFSLMGFSRRYANSGLGDYLFLSCMEAMGKLGYSGANTTISVNNMPILNCISRIGGKFKYPTVTFHYWHQSISSLTQYG